MGHLYASTAKPSLLDAMIHAQGDAPFMQAAKYGHVEAMKFILQLVPSLQAKHDMIHSQNDAPIAAALAHQQRESVAFLINEAENIGTRLRLNASDIKNNMFHAMEDGAFKIAILRDMEDEYKQHSLYGSTAVASYAGDPQEVSAEIIDVFFNHDFSYFKKLFLDLDLANTLYISPSAKKCIKEEIRKYDALIGEAAHNLE